MFEQYLLKKNNTIKDVLRLYEETSRQGLPTGIAILADEENRVRGSITEGDVRRAILNGSSVESSVEGIAKMDPICFPEGISYRKILEKLPVELAKRGRRSKMFLGKIILVDDNRELARILNYHELWEQKVATHRHVVVLGLGYVGLTLALVLAEEGFLVSGVDPDQRKIDALRQSQSYIFENGLTEVLREQLEKNFFPVPAIPEEGDVYVISVGTPVKQIGDSVRPQLILEYIETVSRQVAANLSPGNLVVLRSTVPVGTTREVVLPILEEVSGLRCGIDFHLAFAPERTAEGKALKELRSLPQIIGGFNDESVEATAALFRELTPAIVRVSSIEAAESVKLVNNTFRDLIFAYSNHVTQIVSSFNVDIFEVVNAANQGYPRDRVPLPSPGVGGPCLTKDPYIFSEVARRVDMPDTLFDKGRKVNESMHMFLVKRLEEALAQAGKKMADSRILVCGLAFKGHPETGDIRNSSGVEIHDLLKERSGEVFGHDPVAEEREIEAAGIQSLPLYEGFEKMDAVLFLNNNRYYEQLDIYRMVRLMADKPVLLDGWHLFRSEDILGVRPAVYMGLSNIKSSI